MPLPKILGYNIASHPCHYKDDSVIQLFTESSAQRSNLVAANVFWDYEKDKGALLEHCRNQVKLLYQSYAAIALLYNKEEDKKNLLSVCQAEQKLVRDELAKLFTILISKYHQHALNIINYANVKCSQAVLETATEGKKHSNDRLASSMIVGKSKKGFTDVSAQILISWFRSHLDYPYAGEQDKQFLSQATGLSLTQISTWLINQRMRRWKKGYSLPGSKNKANAAAEEEQPHKKQQKTIEKKHNEESYCDEEQSLMISSNSLIKCFEEVEAAYSHCIKVHASSPSLAVALDQFQYNSNPSEQRWVETDLDAANHDFIANITNVSGLSGMELASSVAEDVFDVEALFCFQFA
jgi:hypothetical protein